MTKSTKVTFRKIKGEVVAVFPNLFWDMDGNFASYQHVGQHGAFSPSLLDELKIATKKEYEPLLKELVSLGYDDLEII